MAISKPLAEELSKFGKISFIFIGIFSIFMIHVAFIDASIGIGPLRVLDHVYVANRFIELSIALALTAFFSRLLLTMILHYPIYRVYTGIRFLDRAFFGLRWFFISIRRSSQRSSGVFELAISVVIFSILYVRSYSVASIPAVLLLFLVVLLILFRARLKLRYSYKDFFTIFQGSSIANMAQKETVGFARIVIFSLLYLSAVFGIARGDYIKSRGFVYYSNEGLHSEVRILGQSSSGLIVQRKSDGGVEFIPFESGGSYIHNAQ